MFNGIYTPVITPFTKDEKIDFEKMEHNLNKWGDTGLDGIVILGSNGEFVYLSEKEKEEVINFAVKNFNNDKKKIVGVSNESTVHTVSAAKRAADMGADAVLVLPPHYYKGAMKDEILFRYFSDVADNSPVPVMLYNMPGNTGINLSSALITRLSKHPNIAGIKDTGGNIVQIAETVRNTDDDFAVFAGNTGYLMAALCVGARGATLALANILPDECCKLVNLVKENRIDEARKQQQKLLKINTLVTGKYGVSGLKAAMDMLGYEGGYPRRPLLEAGKEAKDEIKAELERIGVL